MKFLWSKLSKQSLSIIFTLVGIAGLVFYVANYWSELDRLRDLSALSVAILLLLVVATHSVSAVKFRLSAVIFGVHLPYWEAFMIVESGSLINVFPFSAMGFRGLYLKKVHGLKYVDFGLGTVAILATGFVSSGVLGLIGLLTLAFVGIVHISWSLIILFLMYILGPLAVGGIAWWLRQGKRPNPRLSLEDAQPIRWLEIWRSMLNGFDMIVSRPMMMFQFFFLNLATSLLISVRFWLVGIWLGYSVNFASGLVLWNAGQIISAIAVLPSRTVGVRELLVGLSAVGLGESAISGILISTIDRVMAMIVIVLLGIISLLILRRRISLVESRQAQSDSQSSGMAT